MTASRPDSLDGPAGQASGGATLQVRWTVPAAHGAEFADWYDNEHLPEVVALDGVLGGRRFTRQKRSFSSPTERSVLTLYQLIDESVVNRPAFRQLSERPSDRSIAVTAGLSLDRAVYRQIGGDAVSSPVRTPVGGALLQVLIDVDSEAVDEFTSWYEDEHFPAMSAAPGVVGARRFVLEQPPDPSPAAIAFSYCTIYELTEADVVDTPEFRTAGRRTSRRAALGERAHFHVQVWEQAFPAAGALEI